MTTSIGRESDKFMLRFPEGMRDEIKQLATEDGRSMNAKIIELLQFALSNSGLDMDEVYKIAFDQRREFTGKDAAMSKRLIALEAENFRLRARLDLWEPLILQSSPEELAKLRDRLMSLRAVLDDHSAGDLVKDIVPPENLAEIFPSLSSVQRFFEEIRAREDSIPVETRVSMAKVIEKGGEDPQS